jgi:hypothetical protein
MVKLHPYTAPTPQSCERSGGRVMQPHDVASGRWERDAAEKLPNFDRQNSWRQGKDAVLRVSGRSLKLKDGPKS